MARTPSPIGSGWRNILRGHSVALGEMADLVKERLALVDRLIAQHVAQGPPSVQEAGAWVLQAGGKRLRPTLVLAAARTVGYTGESDLVYAAVIEMIHTATLVHDDIIDHATVRRGRPSANSRWGDQLTVLLGDWLFLSAMEMALALGDHPALRLLSRATLRMTEGEILALSLQGRFDVTQSGYLEITERKTAELFAAACAIPATLVTTEDSNRAALHEYGRNLGICFQIVDDLLDLTSSEDHLGKPVFSDLREGRMTLPMILLRPHLDTRECEQITGFLRGAAMSQGDIENLRGLLVSTGSLTEARRIARTFGEQAAAALDSLPAGREKDALASAPMLMLDRTR